MLKYRLLAGAWFVWTEFSKQVSEGFNIIKKKKKKKEDILLSLGYMRELSPLIVSRLGTKVFLYVNG